MKLKGIAFIGEQEMSKGFRLVGIEQAYSLTGEKGASKLAELFESNLFSVLIVSDSIRKFIDRRFLSKLDITTEPLVVFLPFSGESDQESIESLARRILGVDIGGVNIGNNS